MIKTWRERTKDFAEGHITTNDDIARVMQAEIDDLRAALATARARTGMEIIAHIQSNYVADGLMAPIKLINEIRALIKEPK